VQGRESKRHVERDTSKKKKKKSPVTERSPNLGSWKRAGRVKGARTFSHHGLGSAHRGGKKMCEVNKSAAITRGSQAAGQNEEG